MNFEVVQLANELCEKIKSINEAAHDMKKIATKLHQQGFSFERWPDEMKDKYDRMFCEAILVFEGVKLKSLLVNSEGK